MNPVLFIVLLTAATGVGGLALGGGLAVLVKRESPRATSLLLSFTGGLMLAIVSLDMVPEAIEAAGGGMLMLVPIVLVAGFLVTYLLNCWIDKSAHHEDKAHPHHCSDNISDRSLAEGILSAGRLLGYFVIGLITLIAAVNIVNIISANVLGRTQELAMLRGCGMSDRQLRRLILRESALYVRVAGIVSLIMVEGAVAVMRIPFLTHFHDLTLEDLGFTPSFISPLKYLIIAVAVSFVIAAAASLAPADRIVKSSITEAMNMDG